MKYDVTAIGELLIDFACTGINEVGYPAMSANPGGAPGNFLAALNKYGCRTAFLGKVGTDAFGKMLIDTLAAAGIETQGIVEDDSVFTTLAFVTLDESGDRTFSFARKPGADTRLRFDELDLSLIDNCRDFHFGSLSLTDEPMRSTTKRAVAYAKERGKWISYDPNLRKPLWKSMDEAGEQLLWGISQADIVKISDEEVDFLWNCPYLEAAQKMHEEYGVKLVFITLGSDGCFYSNGSSFGVVPTPDGIHVVDTTGAGDIFGGSALSRLLATGKELSDITGGDMRSAALFACCAASLSTQAHGGISSVVPEKTVREAVKSVLDSL
ncbi:MAG: carbohydrate kinase [Clostridiales bacterium]|nr:carbohydrate kinase [Clostridiales bacterium]